MILNLPLPRLTTKHQTLIKVYLYICICTGQGKPSFIKMPLEG